MSKFYKYLDSIYLDVTKPASFTSPNKLFLEVQRRGYYVFDDKRIIEDYLDGVPVYGLYKNSRKRFPTPPVIVLGPNIQGAADLMDVKRVADENDGIKYILVVIDDFSRVLRVRELKNKEAKTVSRAMGEILNEMEIKFKVICCDFGSEFRSEFDNMLKSKGVKMFYAGSSTKCTIVERAIRNLRARIAKYTEYKGGDRYIDHLDDIVNSYNNTFHGSIKMTPKEVNDSNLHIVFKNLYRKKMKFDIKKYRKAYKYPVGTLVRISKEKGLFSREFKSRFSREIFTVDRTYKLNNIELYDVKDCNNDVLTSAFYADELTRVRDNAALKHNIERVFDEELRNGKPFVLVKFDYSKCKEWIPKSSIVERTRST